MHALIVAMVVLVTACSSSSKAPVTPPSDESPVGEPCGGERCEPPARCITVVGMRPESAHDECWVTCGGDEVCPAGMTCTMIHDGPGQVCVPVGRE